MIITNVYNIRNDFREAPDLNPHTAQETITTTAPTSPTQSERGKSISSFDEYTPLSDPSTPKPLNNTTSPIPLYSIDQSPN